MRPGLSAERVRKFRERLKTDPKLNKRDKMALYHSPDYQTSLSQLAFRFNIDFQDGSYVGFPIRMILATFDLQVKSILPVKYQVNCLLFRRESSKQIFNRAASATILDF